MIVYNKGRKPIFINHGVVADPLGGPGHGEVTYCVAPGQGIDLAIFDLWPESVPKSNKLKSQRFRHEAKKAAQKRTQS